ncbi:DUF6104 family protein [Streptomyces avermitilis]
MYFTDRGIEELEKRSGEDELRRGPHSAQADRSPLISSRSSIVVSASGRPARRRNSTTSSR